MCRPLGDVHALQASRGVGPLRVRAPVKAHRSTPPTTAGRLVFGIFAALAEFERDLIRERTLAGLKAERTQGRQEVRAVEGPP